jgi:hypothetical protein
MHTCPPPGAAMAAWLKETNKIDADYGHLLLEQQAPIDPAELRPYFESAHLDAREVFHGDAGLDLHPDAGAPGAHAQYPACLPPTARRGLFGEVLCGLVTEQYGFVGDEEWTIPVFLFRHHADAGIWFEVNRELAAPDGLRQLQSILKERDPDGYAAAVLSMDRALILRGPVVIPRTDLIVLSGNAAATRAAGSTLLPVDAAPAEYTAANPLQIVEVILEGGDLVIDQLYDSLWS